MYSKKQILKFVLLCTIVSILSSLVGCSFLNPIAGKWENSGGSNYCFPELEFSGNSTVKAGSATGTYQTIGNDKIKIDMEFGAVGGFIPGREYNYKIEDNNLRIYDSQMSCEYISLDKPTKVPQRSKEQADLLKSVSGEGKIVFKSMRQPEGLYSMNPDGTNLQALNFPGVSPDCSPDGKQIVDLTMGLSQIFIMNIDGSNSVELLKADNISSPRWSPDGKQIAYVKGYPDSGITDYSNILVINVDGTNQTQLTTASEKNIYNVNPIWTSDGKIAFTQSSVGSQDKYFIMNSDGTKVSEISKDVYDNYSKEWSPDKTAYVREVDGPFDIAIFNADGAVSVRLLDDKISDFSPTWCP